MRQRKMYLPGRNAMLVLIFLIVILSGVYNISEGVVEDPVQEEITFLNDRSASLIGSLPLTARGFVRPDGLTGAGQVVALADSGLGNGKMDDLHPDLRSKPGQMPKVIMLKSWAGRQVPDDPDGHGTHMAATIAGTGQASKEKFAGIAPGASIYFQAILDPDGKPAPPKDLNSLFRPAYAAAARIHVDGWGGRGNSYLPNAAQVDEFVRQHPDFLVIFGAGNTGPEEGTLTPEANSKNALVVGASEGVRPAFGPESDNPLEVARFSSRGPTPDGRIKPDLVAPGTGIVSAASPLIKSNFPADPLYTRMQGTSMAAAVTGGAAALLREYFQKEEHLKSPSAALLKAALINAAQPLPGSGAGFGRLDLARTVLSLKEKSFFYVDEQDNPLSQNDIRSYQFQVTNRREPLHVTLAWTDPPAPPGAAKTLINNLDLVVISPDGRKFFGNDNERKGNADTKNNVERVIIPYPYPGIYTILVRATALMQGTFGQDFALVFGQPLVQEIVCSVDKHSRTIEFASGRKMVLPDTGRNVLGRYLVPWDPRHIFPGEDVYFAGSGSLYLTGQVWRSPAVQSLPLSRGTLLLESDRVRREGGFYLNPRVSIIANEKSITDITTIPAGIPAISLVNPSSGTVWSVRSSYAIKEGIIRKTDIDTQRLFLFGEEKPYLLAGEVTFSFTDVLVDGNRFDLPFGAPLAETLQQLVPGMFVRMVLSPSDNQVRYVAVRRSVAVGNLAALDLNREQLLLEDGQTYRVITNVPVVLDGKPARLIDLRPGTHLALLLADDLVISITANSNVAYGQVIYYSYEENNLYLLDYRNRLLHLKVSPQIQFFRWWQPGDIASLLPGEWTRVALNPESREVCRIDVADAKIESSRLVSYDSREGLVSFSSQQSLISSRTLVLKNGYRVRMEDILPGEEVECTVLSVPGSNKGVLAQVKGRTGEGIKAPLLSVGCRSMGARVVLEGITEGDYIYVYPEEGPVIEVKPDIDGRFFKSFSRPQGKYLQVVTVDRKFGGVSGMYVTIPEPLSFNDINGHPLQKEITELVDEGVVSGYPDRSFRPEQKITRAEFVVMIARVLNQPAAVETSQVFIDPLPPWASQAINFAYHKGLVTGYPDGKFYPSAPVTGLEALTILARVLESEMVVSRSGLDTGRLSSNVSLSRAEAVSLIYQLQKIVKAE